MVRFWLSTVGRPARSIRACWCIRSSRTLRIDWRMDLGSTTNSALFFCSSRRRHTRLQGDWSSDVCSSDLYLGAEDLRAVETHADRPPAELRVAFGLDAERAGELVAAQVVGADHDGLPSKRCAQDRKSVV